MNRRQFQCQAGLLAAAPLLTAAQAAHAAAAADATRSAAEDTSTEHWFIFLETGRKTPDDKAAVAAMQRGHIDNFKRLFALGQLQAAGPMRDPAGTKRGMVTVKAVTRAEVDAMFQPDAYVREGYMTLNAQPARVRRGLNTTGIDDTRVVEQRIVLVLRGAAAQDAATQAASDRYLQALLDRGAVGAWYTLTQGPVAEVLFANTTETAPLVAALVNYPGLVVEGAKVAVWPQWLSPGVVR